MDNLIIEEQLEKVNEKNAPAIIQLQFENLQKLEEKTTQAIKRAEEAQNSAKRAKEKSAGFGKKKEAIEALQEVAIDLGDAQIASAEAHKVAFQFQEGLGKITEQLFALGISNIALNRIVVRELELRLAGASKEELSDLARQELLNVVSQLKAQEDIAKKQSDLSNRVKEHEIKLTLHDQREDQQDALLSQQIEKDNQHDFLLAAQGAKEAEHTQLIAEQREKDTEHDRLIEKRVEKDKEHDRLLSEQAKKDKEHDRLLAEQAKKEAENEFLLSKCAEKDVEYDRLLSVQAQKDKQYEDMLKQLKIGLNENREVAKRQMDLIADLNIQLQAQQAHINQQTEQTAELENTLSLKATQKTTIVIGIVAAVSMILTVLQYVF